MSPSLWALFGSKLNEVRAKGPDLVGLRQQFRSWYCAPIVAESKARGYRLLTFRRISYSVAGL